MLYGVGGCMRAVYKWPLFSHSFFPTRTAELKCWLYSMSVSQISLTCHLSPGIISYLNSATCNKACEHEAVKCAYCSTWSLSSQLVLTGSAAAFQQRLGTEMHERKMITHCTCLFTVNRQDLYEMFYVKWLLWLSVNGCCYYCNLANF